MFTSINRTVFDIPLTWDRTRFEASRIKCRQARKLIEMSINGNIEKKIFNIISFLY
jgi:DNA primase large subunit